MAKTRQPKTIGEVIDKSIAENRIGAVLFYFLAVVAVLGGIAVLIGAIVARMPLMGLGAAASGLALPAMKIAKDILKQNMAIRLMEIPLNKADTAEQAAEFIQRFFESTFQEPSRPNKDNGGK